MDYPDKEVRFDKYCETCKHRDEPEVIEPCMECLLNPVNYETEKPVKWEEKK